MSENILDIIERIKKLKDVHSDAKVSDCLGFKERRGLQYYKDTNTIPYEYLVRFAQKEGVSLEWLIGAEEKPDNQSSNMRSDHRAYYDAVMELNKEDRKMIAFCIDILSPGKDEDVKDALRKNIQQFLRLARFIDASPPGDRPSPDRVGASGTKQSGLPRRVLGKGHK
jgi:hypothetical protein